MKQPMLTRQKSNWAKQFAFVPVRLRGGKVVWFRWVYCRTIVAMEYVEPVIYIREYDLEENIIMEALTK